MRFGFDRRTAALAGLAVVLALALSVVGYVAGGIWAGALGALAGLVSAPVLEAAIERRARNAARGQRREELVRRFALRPLAEGEVARYLRPENQVVSFRDRPELGQLVAWCKSPAPTGVRLVTGPGGAGKTRLALRLVEELAADQELAARRWQPLWVPRGSECTAVTALQDIGQPCLLVVDYAETRERELAGLLNGVAGNVDGPALRVLLLARSAQEWWQRLLGYSEEPARRLLGEAATPITLGPVPARDGPQELFDDALTAFSRKLGVDRPDARLDLSDPDPVVLVIHAAALLAVVDHATGTRRLQRTVSDSDVLNALLDHEESYWWKTAQSGDLKLDPAVLRLAIAAGYLIGAENQTSAAEMLSRIPDLDSPERRGQVARWMHDLYPVPHRDGAPGKEWLGPLQPDRIAEQLVTNELAERPELIPGLFNGLGEARATRALTVLARAAQNDNRAEGILDRALASDLDHLAIPALEVAVQTSPVTSELLSRAIDSPQVSRETLTRIAEVATRPSVALAPPAAVALRLLAKDSEDDSQRAGWLMKLSDWLGDLGDREEALTAIEAAVRSYRQLARERPDAFQANLVTSLNSQSMRLAELGRRKQALTAIDKAVRICRELADESPDASRPELAAVLHTRSYRLADLGQRDQALTAINETVRIYQELAQAHPGEFRADVGISLNSQSMRLADLGQRDEALTVIDEAARIYRELARASPDRFRPRLADVLQTQSHRLADLGRRDQALTAIDEAARIYQELARVRPNAFRPGLADVLQTQSDQLADLGQRDQALTAINEAVGIYRELTDLRPGAFRPGLAISLNSQSMRLADLGRGDEKALTAAEETAAEAVRICRQLEQEFPEAFRPTLADVLHTQSHRLADLGKHDEALTAINEAVGIYRELEHEFSAAFRPSLALSLNSQSMRLADLGQRDEALTAADEAARICRQLEHEFPGAFRSTLADVLYTQSYRLAELGKHDEALTTGEEAVRIYRQLADEFPAAFRPTLAGWLKTLSMRYSDLGRHQEALTAREQAAAIDRELADAPVAAELA